MPGQWYLTTLLCGVGAVIGFAAVGILVGVGLFVLLVRLWALVRSTGLADWHVGYGSYRFLRVRSHQFGIRTTWGGRTPRTEHRQHQADRAAKGGRPRRRVSYGGHLSCEAQRWQVTRQFIQQMSVRGGGTPREQGIGQGMGEGPDRYATPASHLSLSLSLSLSLALSLCLSVSLSVCLSLSRSPAPARSRLAWIVTSLSVVHRDLYPLSLPRRGGHFGHWCAEAPRTWRPRPRLRLHKAGRRRRPARPLPC